MTGKVKLYEIYTEKGHVTLDNWSSPIPKRVNMSQYTINKNKKIYISLFFIHPLCQIPYCL